MRLALPGSALVHAGVVGLLFFGFVWPEAEDAAPPAPVTVDIVPMSTVASNATEVVATSNTLSLVSSGSPQTVGEVLRKTLEPVQNEVAKSLAPIVVGSVQPQAAALAESDAPSSVAVAPAVAEIEASAPREVAEPEAAQSVEALRPLELSATAPRLVAVAPVDAVATEALAPLAAVAPDVAQSSETLEPVETQTLVTPPAMPTPSSQRPPPPRDPSPQEPRPRPVEAPANVASGNRGDSDADSTATVGAAAAPSASNGSGGDAEVARYPSRVIAELRSAMRQGGTRGEVVVRFTLNASGALTNVGISRSSDIAEVDAAGIAIVQRAAPFPAIPSAAGRSSWTFDVPLAFGN